MLGARKLKNKLEEDFLKCSICCSQFKDPRVLKCQHSFCYGCLEAQHDNLKKPLERKIQCAICRKATFLTKKGVEGLSGNLVIRGLLQMLQENTEAVHSSQHDESIVLLQFKRVDAKNAAITKQPDKPGTSKTPAVGGSKPTGCCKSAACSCRDALKSRGVNKPVHPHNKTSESSVAKPAKDKNDNTSKVSKRVEPVLVKPARNKNNNKPSLSRKTREKEKSAESSSGSSSDTSATTSMEEFTPTDDESGSSDDSTENSSSYDDDESDDAPLTPTLKSSHGIKIGMKVFIFNSRGRPFPGSVRVLERYKRKAPGQTRVYAGVELERENARLATEDLEDMDDSYLFDWLMDYDFPCTVVRVDQCCPAKLVDKLSHYGAKN